MEGERGTTLANEEERITEEGREGGEMGSEKPRVCRRRNTSTAATVSEKKRAKATKRDRRGETPPSQLQARQDILCCLSPCGFRRNRRAFGARTRLLSFLVSFKKYCLLKKKAKKKTNPFFIPEKKFLSLFRSSSASLSPTSLSSISLFCFVLSSACGHHHFFPFKLLFFF